MTTRGSTPPKGASLVFCNPGVSSPSWSWKPQPSYPLHRKSEVGRARQSPQGQRQSTFARWMPASASTCPTRAGFPGSQPQTLPKTTTWPSPAKWGGLAADPDPGLGGFCLVTRPAHPSPSQPPLQGLGFLAQPVSQVQEGPLQQQKQGLGQEGGCPFPMGRSQGRQARGEIQQDGDPAQAKPWRGHRCISGRIGGHCLPQSGSPEGGKRRPLPQPSWNPPRGLLLPWSEFLTNHDHLQPISESGGTLIPG